jgi:CRISPR-associated protein Csm1
MAKYLVKGDLSGIQDFIFNVRSEGAARSLKARSFFVSAVAMAAVEMITTHRKISNPSIIFEGGGNFYLSAESDTAGVWNSISSEINEALQHFDLALTISHVPFDTDTGSFGQRWQQLSRQSQTDKTRAFHGLATAFIPFDKCRIASVDFGLDAARDLEVWPKLAVELLNAKALNWQKGGSVNPRIYPNGLAVFGQKLTFAQQQGKSLDQSLLNKLPKWESFKNLSTLYVDAIKKVKQQHSEQPDQQQQVATSGLITFQYLAAFAQQRTGTAQLGILKLDVDDLSKQFEQIADEAEAIQRSKAIERFFGSDLLALLKNGKFQYNTGVRDQTNKESFEPHIYPIFSGGDDCFFIGGWDVMLQFAEQLQHKFETTFSKNGLTLSAALLVVDDKFPVVRFAELADSALGAAKANRRLDKAGQEHRKNSIALFGQILTWSEFREAAQIAQQLQQLIRQYGVSKAILNRLKHIAAGYGRMQEDVLEGQAFKIFQVNSLTFFIGKLKNEGILKKETNREGIKILENITQKAVNAIIQSFMAGEQQAPALFPVAARWAELLCRNAKSSS